MRSLRSDGVRECPPDNLNTGSLISSTDEGRVVGPRNFACLLLLRRVLTEIKSSLLSDECDSLDSDLLRPPLGRTSVFSESRNHLYYVRKWNAKVAESRRGHRASKLLSPDT